MKKIAFYISLSFLILFVYVFFVPLEINQSIIFKPEKVFSINSSIPDALNLKIDGYFFSKKECGYFSSTKGMIHYFSTKEDDQYLVANKYGYIVYKKYGNLITLYSAKGKKIKDIITYCYPYIKKDFPIFFLISTNGRGLSAYSMQGVLLFGPIKLSSIITSIDSDNFFNVLVATSDGNVTYYSKNGDILHKKNFSVESKIPIAKSICTSSTKSIFAVSHGIYPEYISVIDFNNFKSIYSFKTQTNFRYENVLRFIGNRLYFEGIDAINYLTMRNKHIYKISIDGQLESFRFSPSDSILALSSKSNNHYLKLFYKNGIKKLEYEFSTNISDYGFLNETTFFFKHNKKIFIMKRELI